MKTQYSRSGSGALLSRPRVIGGVVTLAVLFILGLRFFLPDALALFARPLWSTGSVLSAGAATGSTFFMDKAALKADRDALATENQELLNENKALQSQLADVQKLAGTAPSTPDRILAGVLARPPVAPYDVLVVGEGSVDGVQKGAFAFGPGGVPIGFVASVTQDTAHIALYSTPGTQTNAWLGDARIPITLVGQSAGAFTATITKTASTTPGTSVMVSGPGALPIGSVLRVVNDPSSPNLTLQIAPIVNPFSVPWVTINRAL